MQINLKNAVICILMSFLLLTLHKIILYTEIKKNLQIQALKMHTNNIHVLQLRSTNSIYENFLYIQGNFTK